MAAKSRIPRSQRARVFLSTEKRARCSYESCIARCCVHVNHLGPSVRVGDARANVNAIPMASVGDIFSRRTSAWRRRCARILLIRAINAGGSSWRVVCPPWHVSLAWRSPRSIPTGQDGRRPLQHKLRELHTFMYSNV